SSFEDIYGAPEARFKAVAEPVTRDPLHRIYAESDNPAFGPLNGPLDNRVEVTFGYNPLELLRYKNYLDLAKGNPKLLDGLAVTAKLDMANGLFGPNPGVLPRVYATDIATPVRSSQEAAAKLASLDPAHETVVEGLSGARQNSGVRARVTGFDGDSYRIHYDAENPAVLRIAEPYFPGW